MPLGTCALTIDRDPTVDAGIAPYSPGHVAQTGHERLDVAGLSMLDAHPLPQVLIIKTADSGDALHGCYHLHLEPADEKLGSAA